MKRLLCMAVCVLVSTVAQATTGLADPACTARGAAPETRLANMRQPVATAIDTLDNAHIRLSSPSLASGTLAYLSVTPDFAPQLDKVCLLGYFELRRGSDTLALPITFESVEVVKDVNPHDASQVQPTTRIHFRVPNTGEFGSGSDNQPFWKLWEQEQSLRLKIAAYAYTDGSRGAVYFGRDMPVIISHQGTSIFAALLFAVFFYLIAGIAVAPVARTHATAASGLHNLGPRLLPWNITGQNGQASLSQLQMLVFTLIVATLLFYQWLRTGLLEELSNDLLYLIGISTAGTAASQVAVAIRKNLDDEVYRYVQQLGWFTAPVAESRSGGAPSGLLMTDRRFDIYKFQMLVFTCVIAAYVVASGASKLGSLHISATLLTLMGMSQGAYVGGRAATDLLSPLQDQLRGMQALQRRYIANTDPKIAADLRQQFRRAAGQAGAMFESMFGRMLPSAMLEIPPDAHSASGAENEPPTASKLAD
ncbi:hypothetical protein GJ699_14370 [Duganella sp. FT80W]|uniref:Uncharacterized protein n=1 Tax=Duganella guangzhouensis TaxID=2666084 RepID=A0A6I2L1S9_9BURK|nr:hypothetical protein [Duganella guangzhouensis]MRW91177.1 hypothetical protein [Duganella guangzhouensis]